MASVTREELLAAINDWLTIAMTRQRLEEQLEVLTPSITQARNAEQVAYNKVIDLRTQLTRGA